MGKKRRQGKYSDQPIIAASDPANEKTIQIVVQVLLHTLPNKKLHLFPNAVRIYCRFYLIIFPVIV